MKIAYIECPICKCYDRYRIDKDTHTVECTACGSEIEFDETYDSIEEVKNE